MKSKFHHYLTFFVILITIFGCGGGTSQDPTMNNVAGGGIGGSGITSVGAITELGKTVTVNGVSYEVNNSNVVIGENNLGNDTSGLKLGMVVKIRGTINSDGLTGKAELINFDANVEGSVTAIDIIANTFVILGQTIVVDSNTIFEINNQIVASGLSMLALSDYVEVSGFNQINGNILATRVEKKVAQIVSEVKGMVKNLNSQTMTFNINNLQIDYSNAILKGFTGNQISNGDFLQAKGSVNLDTGALIATKIEKENVEIEHDNGIEFKLTGFISSVDATKIDILTSSGNISITIKETTKFDNGTVVNLIAGVKVKVECLSVDGTLVAKEISFNDKNSVTDNNDEHNADNDKNQISDDNSSDDSSNRNDDNGTNENSVVNNNDGNDNVNTDLSDNSDDNSNETNDDNKIIIYGNDGHNSDNGDNDKNQTNNDNSSDDSSNGNDGNDRVVSSVNVHC